MSRLAALWGAGALLLSVARPLGDGQPAPKAKGEGVDNLQTCGPVADGDEASLLAVRALAGPTEGDKAADEAWSGRPAVSMGGASAAPRGREGASVTVNGAELYTNESFKYGRFEASIQFAGASGVISSFFLWKPGSESPENSWNELDFEKVGLTRDGECKMQLNRIGGDPGPEGTEQVVRVSPDICTDFHTYAFEWTPGRISWFVDSVEVRVDRGRAVRLWNRGNDGMQFRFNLWVGDADFGGNFSEGSLPLFQYIDWVKYSSWDRSTGSFTEEWVRSFEGASLPPGWRTGDWLSPRQNSRHSPDNALVTGGYAVLALTPSTVKPSAGDIPPP